MKHRRAIIYSSLRYFYISATFTIIGSPPLHSSFIYIPFYKFHTSRMRWSSDRLIQGIPSFYMRTISTVYIPNDRSIDPIDSIGHEKYNAISSFLKNNASIFDDSLFPKRLILSSSLLFVYQIFPIQIIYLVSLNDKILIH